MKRGLLKIQCSQCPEHLTGTGLRDEFARAVTERGWRVLAKKGGRARAVCPACAKKVKAADLAAPRSAGATV